MTHRVGETTPLGLTEARPTLVLSPHLDDALLSASSIVLDLPCEVWTVFTGQPSPPQTTTWDTSCGFADSDATITARRREDAAAFTGTPARTRHLGALEGAYATREQHRAALPAVEREIDGWMTGNPRGCVIIPACAGLHMPPPPWEGAVRALRRFSGHGRRTDVTDEHPAAPDGGVVFATPPGAHDAAGSSAPITADTAAQVVTPPALARHAVARIAARPVRLALHAEHLRRRRRTMGDDGLAAHPDHLALRDAALRAAARHPGIRVVLFEDLPYLWHARGDDEVARLSADRGFRVTRTALPVNRGRKHAHLAHYASQLPVLDAAGRLEQADTLPDAEVYWVIEERR